MPKYLLLCSLLGCSLFSLSQNVGIGTTTPAFKLDVRNGRINTDSAYHIRGYSVLSIPGTNTFAGINSGMLNSSGYENATIGYQSFRSNTIGYKNVALGSYTLFDNTEGSRNTAIGSGALSYNNIGYFNSAVGNNALLYNEGGTFNTAVGYDAMNANVNGNHNVAMGCRAAYVTSAAEYNTIIGFAACSNYDIGWNNTVVGAEANVTFSGLYNGIAIGNLARATDNSKVRIGNSSNWSYEAFANWTNISDGRYKKNIQETVAGLNFIMKLRPVNYQMDITGLSKKFDEDKGRENDNFMKAAIAEKEQMTWTGFIAQEVEAAAKASDFTFSGVDKPRNEHGVYGLRYAEFVVPLVKAVQEQQAIIDELRKKNKELEARMERMELRIEN